jgi:hypothetical protein
MAGRPIETFITLILEHVDSALAEAHRGLYPERVREHIPLSLDAPVPVDPGRVRHLDGSGGAPRVLRGASSV